MKVITLALFAIIALAYVSGQDVSNSADPSTETKMDSVNSQNAAPSNGTSPTTGAESTAASSGSGKQPCRCPPPRFGGPNHGFGRFRKGRKGGPPPQPINDYSPEEASESGSANSQKNSDSE